MRHRRGRRPAFTGTGLVCTGKVARIHQDGTRIRLDEGLPGAGCRRPGAGAGYDGTGRRNRAVHRNGSPKHADSGPSSCMRRSSTSARPEKIQRRDSAV